MLIFVHSIEYENVPTTKFPNLRYYTKLIPPTWVLEYHFVEGPLVVYQSVSSTPAKKNSAYMYK